jgi:hypothetical protein
MVAHPDNSVLAFDQHAYCSNSGLGDCAVYLYFILMLASLRKNAYLDFLTKLRMHQ